MALNKYERELLVVARDLVATKRVLYICCALEVAASQLTDKYFCSSYDEYNAYYAGENRLKKYISDALCGALTLRGWQLFKGMDRGSYALIVDRLAWIDWMLDQPEIE